MKFNEMWIKFKNFVVANKTASIITASVLGVAVVGGTTAGIVYAVNNNADTREEQSVNTTDMVANQLAGQEINPTDLQDTTEEVQADGTTLIKDKSGTVIAKKDASGKTTLTEAGAVSVASGNQAINGSLANMVADTNTNVVASLPDNTYDVANNSYVASNNDWTAPASTPASTSTPTNNWTPSYSVSEPQDCAHGYHSWVTKSKTVVDVPAHTESAQQYDDDNSYSIYTCPTCGFEAPAADIDMQVDHMNAYPQHEKHWTPGWHQAYKTITWEVPAITHEEYWQECSKCGARM